MNSRELFLQACRCAPVPRPPVWLMRQVGRYMPRYQALRAHVGFVELLRRPDLAAEASLYVLDDFDPDAIILFSDILTVLGAMGAQLAYEPALTVTADIAALPEAMDETWLEPAYEALAMLRRDIAGRKALIGFTGAPFTLLYYLLGKGDGVRARLLSGDPLVEATLERIARVAALHLRRQAQAGADVLQVFDSHAGDLAPRHYERYALPALRALLDEISDLETPVIVFARGRNHVRHREVLRGNVLSIDWTVPFAALPDRAAWAVQGNLDPAVLLAGPEATRRETDAMLDEAAGCGGYIANLGHGLLPPTPVESVQEFVSAITSRAGA